MFGRQITLFRLFGFAIRIDASWLLIAVLVTWSLAAAYFPAVYPGLQSGTYWWMGVFGALLLFGSIVLHELSHSLVARRYDIHMRGITLFIFGGVADMEREPGHPKAEFMMAAAGPLASIAVGAVAYILVRAGGGAWPLPVVAVLEYLAWMNWVLAAFNLVPAFPLDGGRMLRAGLWGWKNDLRAATRIAASIGSGFGILLMVLAVFQLLAGNLFGAVWWFLIGGFLRMLAQNAYAQVLVRATLKGEPIAQFMNRNPDTVPPAISVEELVDQHIYRLHHRMFPVVSGGDRLEGCVGTEQVRSVPRQEWRSHTVQEIAKPCSRDNTISPDTDAIEALKRMNQTKQTKLMVVDAGRLLGIVTLRDMMSFLSSKLELEGEEPIREELAGARRSAH